MRSLLLLLIAFPLLISCDKVDVSPKEKTTVESNISTSTQSPLVGNYIKVRDDNNLNSLPTTSQLVFVNNTHQLILRDQVIDLLYTGNPKYIATQQDFPYTPNGIAGVEMIESADQTTYRINITYWGKDASNINYITGATYKKN
jgi:hypothetical protein